MANVIPFPEKFRGNGAREALSRVLDAEDDLLSTNPPLDLVDHLLAALWVEGYKVVPLEPDDG